LCIAIRFDLMNGGVSPNQTQILGDDMSGKSEPDRCFICQSVLKMGGTISPLKFGNQIAFLCLACEEKHRPELHELDKLLVELSTNTVFRFWLKSQRDTHH